MRALSKDQRLENILVGQALLIEAEKAKLLTPGLTRYANETFMMQGPHACGSAACFGGLVAITPHFQQYGVHQDTMDGSPVHPETIFPSLIAKALFGDPTIFDHSLREPGRESTLSDAKVVELRLKTAFEHLLPPKKKKT